MSRPLSLPPTPPRRAHGLLRLIGSLVATLVFATGAAQGEPPMPPPGPDETKATHLHRFSGFVEWPASSFAAPDAPIVVGIVGAQGLHRELAQVVAGRLVQNRPILVLELSEPRQASTVHMLMIGRGAWKRTGEWLAGAKGHPVLVVTDMPQGLERGAALSFVETDARLRFEASVPAAEAAGVRLSSRLLSLAERVLRTP
jgi:hypothetical protein